MDGTPIPWLQPIDSISGNGRHAVVVAPGLVRIEMFRVGQTYELAITRHALQARGGQNKPVMVSAPLFRGREGTLSLDIQAKEIRESEEDSPIYSNLDDDNAGLHQQDVDYLRPVLAELGIEVPEQMFLEVQADQLMRVGNRDVDHTPLQ